MKLKINYDLIRKIRESQNGIRLHRIVKARAINLTSCLVFLTPFYINGTLKNIIASISGIIVANAIFAYRDYLFEKISKDARELKANLELYCLAIALSRLEVRTTDELLKDAEIIQTNYKLKFRDSDKLPVIKEEKYIEVPLCNGYKETLLQEHNIGSKDYELSVQEPVKKMQFKHAKATQ